jgi:hypothetical protein
MARFFIFMVRLDVLLKQYFDKYMVSGTGKRMLSPMDVEKDD